MVVFRPCLLLRWWHRWRCDLSFFFFFVSFPFFFPPFGAQSLAVVKERGGKKREERGQLISGRETEEEGSKRKVLPFYRFHFGGGFLLTHLSCVLPDLLPPAPVDRFGR